LTTGTIMEATHLGLDQWMVGVWLIVNCRNGVSSCEIARTIGCKQQSAWHLLHRVRRIMQEAGTELMSGPVEADATWIGGIVTNMPNKRRDRYLNRGPQSNKTAVHAIRERRSGRVRASVIARESKESTYWQIAENVKPGSPAYTDASKVYDWMDNGAYRRESVNHSAGEYVRGDVSTNGCENFFSCLRRGLKGTYIRTSTAHLQAYVDEAVFRFNVRDLTEWERFDHAMRQIVGARLTYKELTGGSVR
ncbi:MAG: IS1595 family transposase, partial [Phycisphaerales bacterium]|nr:IS1595 family transposase [Phycisphaerales bacterium]